MANSAFDFHAKGLELQYQLTSHPGTVIVGLETLPRESPTFVVYYTGSPPQDPPRVWYEFDVKYKMFDLFRSFVREKHVRLL